MWGAAISKRRFPGPRFSLLCVAAAALLLPNAQVAANTGECEGGYNLGAIFFSDYSIADSELDAFATLVKSAIAKVLKGQVSVRANCVPASNYGQSVHVRMWTTAPPNSDTFVYDRAAVLVKASVEGGTLAIPGISASQLHWDPDGVTATSTQTSTATSLAPTTKTPCQGFNVGAIVFDIYNRDSYLASYDESTFNTRVLAKARLYLQAAEPKVETAIKCSYVTYGAHGSKDGKGLRVNLVIDSPDTVSVSVHEAFLQVRKELVAQINTGNFMVLRIDTKEPARAAGYDGDVTDYITTTATTTITTTETTSQTTTGTSAYTPKLYSVPAGDNVVYFGVPLGVNCRSEANGLTYLLGTCLPDHGVVGCDTVEGAGEGGASLQLLADHGGSASCQKTANAISDLLREITGPASSLKLKMKCSSYKHLYMEGSEAEGVEAVAALGNAVEAYFAGTIFGCEVTTMTTSATSTQSSTVSTTATTISTSATSTVTTTASSSATSSVSSTATTSQSTTGSSTETTTMTSTPSTRSTTASTTATTTASSSATSSVTSSAKSTETSTATTTATSPTSTITKTTTTTTVTTTTTPTTTPMFGYCNGAEDPDTCFIEFKETACTGALKEYVRKLCPAMCNSCVTTTQTSTATSTITSTVTTTTSTITTTTSTTITTITTTTTITSSSTTTTSITGTTQTSTTRTTTTKSTTTISTTTSVTWTTTTTSTTRTIDPCLDTVGLGVISFAVYDKDSLGDAGEEEFARSVLVEANWQLSRAGYSTRITCTEVSYGSINVRLGANPASGTTENHMLSALFLESMVAAGTFEVPMVGSRSETVQPALWSRAYSDVVDESYTLPTATTTISTDSGSDGDESTSEGLTSSQTGWIVVGAMLLGIAILGFFIAGLVWKHQKEASGGIYGTQGNVKVSSPATLSRQVSATADVYPDYKAGILTSEQTRSQPPVPRPLSFTPGQISRQVVSSMSQRELPLPPGTTLFGAVSPEGLSPMTSQPGSPGSPGFTGIDAGGDFFVGAGNSGLYAQSYPIMQVGGLSHYAIATESAAVATPMPLNVRRAQESNLDQSMTNMQSMIGQLMREDDVDSSYMDMDGEIGSAVNDPGHHFYPTGPGSVLPNTML